MHRTYEIRSQHTQLHTTTTNLFHIIKVGLGCECCINCGLQIFSRHKAQFALLIPLITRNRISLFLFHRYLLCYSFDVIFCLSCKKCFRINNLSKSSMIIL
uniref:Uncharacterized protein n=1 Tax=Arundo donax TaxID=35708 RepID=A0A0A9FHK7_ARUDO